MVNTRYANAYKEVLIIIDNLVKEDYKKIPKEYIKFLESNCNNDYEFEYDNSKLFVEQELLDDTKYILFGLFEKFGATDIQKTKIESYKSNYNNKLEQQKRETYNPNNIFKKDVINEVLINNDTFSQNALVKVKESTIFQKIAQKIKNFFHIS